MSGPGSDSTVPVSPPGAQLAARRAELNLTVEEVASQLNLAPRQVHAIEDDNYAALPGIAIVRGFIRSYAKLVKIDPVPLLAQIAAETTSAEEGIPLRRPMTAQPFIEGRITGMRKSRFTWPRIALGVVVIALIGLAVADRAGLITFSPFKASHQANRAASATSQSTDVGSAPAGVGTLSTELRNFSAESARSAGGQSAAPSGPAPAPGPATAAPAQPGSNAAMTPGSAGEAVTLKLAEDSWVQLAQPDGVVILSRLLKAGTNEVIPVSAPVVLTIGNAKGVDASFRGAQLDLSRQTRSNVARLDLK
ncbi:MAG: putative rane protein [Herminiimonas sp.]|nr:putative rane protein [Herminiimonas sp.]